MAWAVRNSRRGRAAPPAALALRCADIGQRAVFHSDALFRRSAGVPGEWLEQLSPLAALRAARQARRRVPAYRAFLERAGWRDDPRLPVAERLRRLPEMDKANYVTAFSTEERCLDGKLPMAGTQIDESSGSTGIPFNWVRSRAELAEIHGDMSRFVRYLVGDDLITINSFSMGAWATGVNVGEALRANGIVKSTGPDVDKILHTLRFFGPRYTYAVTGYPPFLKHLLDQGGARGFPWADYRLFGLVGGEGMSEGLRAYLERHFRAVYSGYGASDLTIGIGTELPLTVWIRQRAAEDPRLHAVLFGQDPRLPMLFQFNPLDYYVETNDRRELVVTMNRLTTLSPRIRYNVHDAGGTLSYGRALGILRDFGLDAEQSCTRPPFRLPFLFLFGRSDSTISYMGANIYPEDVEAALYADADDARRLGAYCLELLDADGGELRPCVHVEVSKLAAEDGALAGRLRAQVLRRLLATNLDFRTAVAEDATAADLIVRLYEPGRGPFAANDGRIKRRYILRSTPAAAEAAQ